MNRDEYRSLRRRYRQARRDDSRHTTMNASECRRGVLLDRAGAIRMSVPADIADTLGRPVGALPVAGPRLQAALIRVYETEARKEMARRKQSAVFAALAASRALTSARHGEVKP